MKILLVHHGFQSPSLSELIQELNNSTRYKENESSGAE